MTIAMTEAPIPGYAAGTWEIDPVHSYVGFVITHMMVSRSRGHFTRLSGQIVTGASLLDSRASARISADSIDTSHAARDAHVRSADFLDAGRHPFITFSSTGLRRDNGGYRMDGDLTIRGVTKPVWLTVDNVAFGRGLDGGMKAGFSASGQIDRTDFGVSFNGPLPGGGVALSRKVQIVIEIEAALARPA